MAPKTLWVLVDGLGLGPPDSETNPLRPDVCAHLRELLREAVAVDAGLGVAGTPQSATGQTTLLTGVNAAERIGRHAPGFPDAQLKELLHQHNVFDRLLARGYRPTFANAYYLEGPATARLRRFPSATTVATLKAFGRVRDQNEMLRGEAVYHDLTRLSLRARGFRGPWVTPCESAEQLVRIAERHDLTLFEYFLTDRAAHTGDATAVRAVLAQLDEFVGVARSFGNRPGGLFVLISDHGAVEDLRARGHTMNPVPLVAVGDGADFLRKHVRRLDDFVPALLRLYPPRMVRATDQRDPDPLDPDRGGSVSSCPRVERGP